MQLISGDHMDCVLCPNNSYVDNISNMRISHILPQIDGDRSNLETIRITNWNDAENELTKIQHDTVQANCFRQIWRDEHCHSP